MNSDFFNIFTKEIADLTDLNLKEARKVQDYIEEHDLLNYSEATDKEFKSAVFFALGAIGGSNGN